MVLTDVERLILANQFEILGKLNEDPSLEELSSHLKSGYSWIYDQSYALHVSPDFDDHDTQIVLNILEVFESIQVSYDKLSDEDKKKYLKLPSYSQALMEIMKVDFDGLLMPFMRTVTTPM